MTEADGGAGAAPTGSTVTLTATSSSALHSTAVLLRSTASKKPESARVSISGAMSPAAWRARAPANSEARLIASPTVVLAPTLNASPTPAVACRRAEAATCSRRCCCGTLVAAIVVVVIVVVGVALLQASESLDAAALMCSSCRATALLESAAVLLALLWPIMPLAERAADIRVWEGGQPTEHATASRSAMATPMSAMAAGASPANHSSAVTTIVALGSRWLESLRGTVVSGEGVSGRPVSVPAANAVPLADTVGERVRARVRVVEPVSVGVLARERLRLPVLKADCEDVPDTLAVAGAVGVSLPLRVRVPLRLYEEVELPLRVRVPLREPVDGRVADCEAVAGGLSVAEAVGSGVVEDEAPTVMLRVELPLSLSV